MFKKMSGLIKRFRFFYLFIITIGVFAALSGCGIAQVSKKDQLKSNLYYGLGAGFYRNGNFIKSMQEFIRAEALNPNSAKNYNAIGMVYMETDRENKAILNFKKAIRINPRFSDSYYNLAIIYIKRKNYKQAETYLKKALKNPFYNRPFESYTELGKIYIAEKEFKKAKKILTISRLMDKRYFLTYYYLGNYYLAEGKLDESMNNFRKVLSLNAFFIPAKYKEGIIYFRQKKYDKAKKVFISVYNENKLGKYGIKSFDYLKKIISYPNK